MPSIKLMVLHSWLQGYLSVPGALGEARFSANTSRASASSFPMRARPSCQTRWSKALVRHGAEAREALAGVLGVPAADIRVREGAG